MGTIEFSVLIFFIITLGLFIVICKFLVQQKKKTTDSTYAELFIDLINSVFYKKEVLTNHYDQYYGAKEDIDVDEYIKFISSGILDVFNNKE